MIDGVISFDKVIDYQAIKQKETYIAKCSNIATKPPFPNTHYCVQVCLVLLQTVTGLAVYVCASSSASYYANSQVGLIT